MTANKAKVIFLIDKQRYFSSYVNKRVNSAWSLAGAQLFLFHDPNNKIDSIEELLKSKGIRYQIKNCEII